MAKEIHLTVMVALLSITAIAQQKILFVMSSANELQLRNSKTYKETGVFLSEFYLTYKSIIQLGYEIDLATPDGIQSSIDKESLEKKYWDWNDTLLREAKKFVHYNEKFKNPEKLENVLQNIDEYSGLVIPGGQGLMVDLIHDERIPKLIKEFSDQGKAIGLICHAPALILSIPKAENPFIGYRVNSVTRLEEFFIEKFVMKGKPTTRKIGKQLKESGLRYKKGRPAGNFAIRDRELITSQNPYSNQAFIKLYREALNEYKLNNTLRQ